MSTHTFLAPLLVSSIAGLGACVGPMDSPASDTQPASLVCAPPLHGPTAHAGDVQGDEVWRAVDGPHVVTSDVRVRNGARLTVEPCAVVEFAPRASMEVAGGGPKGAGTLVAEGTAARPIHFRRAHSMEAWGYLLVAAPGEARLAHVTLAGGGAIEPDGVTLWLRGDGVLPSDPVLFADRLTVKASRGVGVRTDHGARFVRTP